MFSGIELELTFLLQRSFRRFEGAEGQFELL